MTTSKRPHRIRSPLPWMGGKFYNAPRILNVFPDPNTYDIYGEPFGGAASVFLAKPKYNHLECFNDINEDLVNFWMQCRDHPDELRRRLDTLPYARALYYQYHRSLFNATRMDNLERAVRWYYVLRSSFRPQVNHVATGWVNGPNGRFPPDQFKVHSFRHALALFTQVSERFQMVEIDRRDFEPFIKQYESSRTFFYCDPPFIGSEQYYSLKEDAETFHRRLARVLNATPALIALSYYQHPLLEELYPSPKWRRASWISVKHIQRSRKKHSVVPEVLLMNYSC